MPQPLDITVFINEDGKIADSQQRQYLSMFIRLYAGRKCRIRVSSEKRSTRANAYYWGVVLSEIQKGLAMAGIATSTEVLHEHFKRKYLPARAVCVFGIDHVLPASTAQLDSTTFYEYIEAIRFDEDVIEYGIVIDPPPSDLKSSAIAEPT